MGNIFFRVLDFLSGRVHKRLLLLGLDGAGKTTILYRLNMGTAVHTIPTVGFNIESVQYKNIEMTIWDVGGQEKLRPLWHHYFENSDAIIFTIDAADTDESRLDLVRNELHRLMQKYPNILKTDEEKGDEIEESDPSRTNDDLLLENCVAVLIFANKQDLKGSLSSRQLSHLLHLTPDFHNPIIHDSVSGVLTRSSSSCSIRWRIQECCGVSGQGLYEGLEWLSCQLKST